MEEERGDFGRGGFKMEEKESGAKEFKQFGEEEEGFKGGLGGSFTLRLGDSQFSEARGGKVRVSKDI